MATGMICLLLVLVTAGTGQLHSPFRVNFKDVGEVVLPQVKNKRMDSTGSVHSSRMPRGGSVNHMLRGFTSQDEQTKNNGKSLIPGGATRRATRKLSQLGNWPYSGETKHNAELLLQHQEGIKKGNNIMDGTINIGRRDRPAEIFKSEEKSVGNSIHHDRSTRPIKNIIIQPWNHSPSYSQVQKAGKRMINDNHFTGKLHQLQEQITHKEYVGTHNGPRRFDEHNLHDKKADLEEMNKANHSKSFPANRLVNTRKKPRHRKIVCHFFCQQNYVHKDFRVREKTLSRKLLERSVQNNRSLLSLRERRKAKGRVRREAAVVDRISLLGSRREPHDRSFYKFPPDGSIGAHSGGDVTHSTDGILNPMLTASLRPTEDPRRAGLTDSENNPQGNQSREVAKTEAAISDVEEGHGIGESSQELLPENVTNTNNGTAPRHLYRSPMLVDYATQLRRKKAEEEEKELARAEAESGVHDGNEEPVWLKARGPSQDDLDLEAEGPDTAGVPHDDEAATDPAAEPEPHEDGYPDPEPDSEIDPSPKPFPAVPEKEAAAEETEEEPKSESDLSSQDMPESEAWRPQEERSMGDGDEAISDSDNAPGATIGEFTYAEPQPKWDEAKKTWGPCWEIHVYGIGLAFAILGVYALVSVVRLWRKKNLLSQGFFIALNSIVFAVSFFRALYFLVDGYNSNGTFHPVGHYLLFSIGFPCITSAFSILLLALLQTLKMHVISPKIQKTKILVCIIVGHFALSILTDIVVGYFYTAEVMIFVCQVATVLWGLMLFAGYIYVFRKLYKAAIWRQNELMRISLAKIKLEGVSPITKPPKLTLNIAIKITLSTAIMGLILAGLQIYGMVGVFSVFSNDSPNPWVWLVFNTFVQLTQLAMCITMAYVATQPFRYKGSGGIGDKQSRRWSSIIYMAPCRRLFECDSASLHDDDLSWDDLPGHVNDNEVDPQGGSLNVSEEATPMTASGRAAQAAAAATTLVSEKETGSRKSKQVAARPASLLVSDNGFIRFREDGEMGGSPVLLSTDDELDMVNSESSMMRNPFYRDLIRRQEKEKAVGRATYVNSDGINLHGDFGILESSNPDSELIPPPRLTYPLRGSNFRGYSYPNTGTNTPGTPRSFCSTDLDYPASETSYRPPSSIHLRDSIENALNIPGFTLRTPDILDSPLNTAYFQTRRGSLLSRGSRPTGSMSDLESLRHYGVGSRYGDSLDTVDGPSERAGSPDSMYSYTLSNLTKAPLVRSYSDSIGAVSQQEASIPNSPERQYMKNRLRANMLSGHPDNKNQFQTLLRNINDMCNVYNKLSPDDREGDE